MSQVAALSGVSARTLQYYDEIGLLKPSALTAAGYRLYSDEDLQQLQQILFWKELGFKLKEIRDILQQPDLDKGKAYKRQKELLCLKKKRIDRLIGLLDKLEKGENCMSFEEFDLHEYIKALEQFKNTSPEEVNRHWGAWRSLEQFIQKVKDDEANVARLAVRQYGSVEKYTQAMKYNLEHFPEIMKRADAMAEKKEALLQKSDELYRSLTSNLSRDAASEEVRAVVREIISFTQENMLTKDVGEGYWEMVADSYTSDIVKRITDKKYGAGASEYIAQALRSYLHQ